MPALIIAETREDYFLRGSLQVNVIMPPGTKNHLSAFDESPLPLVSTLSPRQKPTLPDITVIVSVKGWVCRGTRAWAGSLIREPLPPLSGHRSGWRLRTLWEEPNCSSMSEPQAPGSSWRLRHCGINDHERRRQQGDHQGRISDWMFIGSSIASFTGRYWSCCLKVFGASLIYPETGGWTSPAYAGSLVLYFAATFSGRIQVCTV